MRNRVLIAVGCFSESVSNLCSGVSFSSPARGKNVKETNAILMIVVVVIVNVYRYCFNVVGYC